MKDLYGSLKEPQSFLHLLYLIKRKTGNAGLKMLLFQLAVMSMAT